MENLMTWDDHSLTPEDRDLLDQVLAINWSHPAGLTYREQQRYMERRRVRSQRVRDEETRTGIVRCKCGTIMTITTGKGPHAARADCPVCNHRQWVGKKG